MAGAAQRHRRAARELGRGPGRRAQRREHRRRRAGRPQGAAAQQRRLAGAGPYADESHPRDRRSAALQAYLIAQRDGSGNLIYGDADGLFNYFLIDVQMTLLPGDLARCPGLYRRADLRRALPDEPRGAGGRGRPHPGRHLEPVGVDEPLPDLGGQPRGLPLSGELADRIRSAPTAPRSTRNSSRRCARARAPPTISRPWSSTTSTAWTGWPTCWSPARAKTR